MRLMPYEQPHGVIARGRDGRVSVRLLEVVTREQARAKGLPLYFEGKPCRYGNLAERRTAGGQCKCLDCARDIYESNRRAKAKKRRARGKDYVGRPRPVEGSYAVVTSTGERKAVVSSAAAKAAGMSWYFTGFPCRHGNVEIRDIWAACQCAECKQAVIARVSETRRKRKARAAKRKPR